MKAVLFYLDNGLVASTDPGWIQLVFDTLRVIFDQVGIQKKRPQDRGDGVQAMPGIRSVVRRGLHTADDRVGTKFQGDTAGTVVLPGVLEGTGEGVTGDAPPNTARCGERGVGAGGRG